MISLSLAVVALRIFIPLTILRWPLAGGLLALAADIYDFVLLNKLGWGGFLNSDTYQPIDKLLDTYYLSLEAFVALRWNDLLARKTAAILFSWRLVGVLAFELTQIRKFLFFSPNIFEYFYLIFLSIKKFNPAFRLKGKWLILLLLLIGIPKLVIEYALHVLEYPLGITRSWLIIKEIIFK